jgi:hypothetical protein
MNEMRVRGHGNFSLTNVTRVTFVSAEFMPVPRGGYKPSAVSWIM